MMMGPVERSRADCESGGLWAGSTSIRLSRSPQSFRATHVVSLHTVGRLVDWVMLRWQGGLGWLEGGRSRCGFSDVQVQCLRVMEEGGKQGGMRRCNVQAQQAIRAIR